VFDEIWQGSITPTVAYEDDEPIAVASYPLTQFPTTRVFDSMSAALETFYGAPESYAGAKEPLREAITTARDKLIRQRDALTRALDDASAAELLKTRGEMILAYASTIQPGQTELVAQVAEGQSLRIPLDPHLSPVANAQKCFSDYRKAQSAAEGLPARLEQVNLPIAYADQLLADVDLAETRADLDAVAQEIRQVGWLKDERKPHAKIRASAPREFTSRAGFTILVGRNARQNDAVTFHRAQADDWWLHARHAAGAHVVILAGGREVDDETLDYAAALAAFYSQARDDTRVEVILTQRKNVRRVKGAPPGLVTVRNEQTLLTTRQR
jgi:predicted ribosome quality control (RQC) complex YloA/Tae2 family protein